MPRGILLGHTCSLGVLQVVYSFSVIVARAYYLFISDIRIVLCILSYYSTMLTKSVGYYSTVHDARSDLIRRIEIIKNNLFRILSALSGSRRKI